MALFHREVKRTRALVLPPCPGGGYRAVMPKQDDTPLMQQWRDAKSRHPDAIVFFRVGDFYEMFCEDAEEGARLLGLTLTSRNNGGAAHVPLAGVPARARDEYVERLIRLGRRVAICEQVETPRAGQLVKRELTRILTPGTTLEDHQIEATANHYLLAVERDKKGLHAAWLDLTTGTFEVVSTDQPEQLLSVFTALSPRELILPDSESGKDHDRDGVANERFREGWERLCGEIPVSPVADYLFDRQEGAPGRMLSQFDA